MSLQLIGAGLPRTGTTSLKAALERLLGRPCYHMNELFAHPEHAPAWQEAFASGSLGRPAFLEGYAATVDTPACVFWRELADAYPDAPVLLSRRADARTWYRSMESTVLAQARRGMQEDAADRPQDGDAPTRGPQQPEVHEVLRSVADFLLADQDEASIEAWYDAWLADVRAAVPAHRLVEWEPGDGWGPLAAALGTAVPDEPFPALNSTAEFRSEHGSR